MKKAIIVASLIMSAALSVNAQGVMDAITTQESQIRGTARYSAMAGAFGALGGELTSISKNPAGIGVYRSSEISLTGSFNFVDNIVTTPSHQSRNNDFYFTGDNMGVVGVIIFKESALRNLNFGFAYNNIYNYNNAYRADWNNISSSLTQLIAAQATSLNCPPSMLDESAASNPYNNLPWLSVLGYNTNLIYNKSQGNIYNSIFDKQNSSGNAYLINYTSGSIDEYDFNISGNVYDVFYWGLTINVTSINYHQESYYGEDLYNIHVADNHSNENRPSLTNGNYELSNYLHTDGYGTGVKFGAIYRPVNFLRLGVAVHSPTYYTMTDTYSAAVDYNFENVNGRHLTGSSSDIQNRTDIGSISYEFCSPWHFMGSIAAVIGKWGIISADYEYTTARDMYYSDIYNNYTYTNQCINSQAENIHNVRIGLEGRITPAFSVRAGYAYQTAPLGRSYFDGIQAPQITEGTIYHYQIPGDVHNITCGLGYRINNISIDAAYVYRTQNHSIYAYPEAGYGYTPTTMNLNNHSIKISLGYRF